MKKYAVSIAEPCSVPLQNMTPVEGGRYCSSCEKQVVDFSNMTDQQFIAYFEKHGRGCGTFRPSQLNREMGNKPVRRWMPAAILAGILSVIWPETGKGQYKLTGFVKDATNCDTIPGATITLLNKEGKPTDITTYAGRDGTFSLPITQNEDSGKMINFNISSIGYETRQLQLSVDQVRANSAFACECYLERSVNGNWVVVEGNGNRRSGLKYRWRRLKNRLFN